MTDSVFLGYLMKLCQLHVNQDSSVSKVTSYKLHNQGPILRREMMYVLPLEWQTMFHTYIKQVKLKFCIF